MKLQAVKIEVGTYVEGKLAEMRTMGGDSGPRQGGGERRAVPSRGLNNPKDTVLSKLGEDPSKGDCLFWRRNLELHLENYGDYGHGIGRLFTKIRRSLTPILDEDVKRFAREVNVDSVKDGTGIAFNDSHTADMSVMGRPDWDMVMAF